MANGCERCAADGLISSDMRPGWSHVAIGFLLAWVGLGCVEGGMGSTLRVLGTPDRMHLEHKDPIVSVEM